MIIAWRKFGVGKPQYRVILSTASRCSGMQCLLNCSHTILLYSSTDPCCDMISRQLTAVRTTHLISIFAQERSGGYIYQEHAVIARAFQNKQTCKTSISGDLYPPSIGSDPLICVYGGCGPQHLWVNSSRSRPILDIPLLNLPVRICSLASMRRRIRLPDCCHHLHCCSRSLSKSCCGDPEMLCSCMYRTCCWYTVRSPLDLPLLVQ